MAPDPMGAPTRAARRARQHTTGWAYAGSQRHIQAYVNTPALRALLDDALRHALPTLADAAFEWRSPLAGDAYAEPRDATFWPAIDQPQLAERCAAWWPARGGPSWDAIALAHRPNAAPAVVLVEAKANVPELTGGDLAATSSVSLAAIRSALNEARERLGATGDVEAWTGPYYQLANRLAWTMWLRAHDVDAVFAHVLFEHDRSHQAASADELTAAVHAAHAMLGVPDRAIAGWATTVVLPGTG